jgi:hypothetical protein
LEKAELRHNQARQQQRKTGLTEQKIVFKRRLLLLGNLALVAWLLVAFVSVWFFNQAAALLLLLFDAFLVYGILRRLGCNNCYLCASCTSGFGRIAGTFYGKGQVKSASVGNRKGVIAFVYLLLFPLPTALLASSIIQEFSALKILVLFGLLAMSLYSIGTWVTAKTKA